MTHDPIELFVRVSDVRTWNECRRRFYLQSVYGVNEESKLDGLRSPSNADIGSIVDHGLNGYFRGEGRISLNTAPNFPVLDGAPVELVKKWVDAMELSGIMLDGFIDWWEENGLSAQLTDQVIQREVSRRFGPFYPYKTGRPYYVTVIGHIDLDAYDNKYQTWSINDFKSVASFLQFPLQVDTQLNLYALLASVDKRHYGVGRHIQLRRVKRTARATPPFYGVREIIINDIQLQRTYALLKASLNDMVRTIVTSTANVQFYPSPTGECSWKCRVREICSVMDDGTDWESIIELSYGTTEESPVFLRPTRRETESE